MKIWVTRYSAIRKTPSDTAVAIGYLYPQVTLDLPNLEGEWVQVQAGWVNTRYLEPLVENYPKDCVDLQGIQTPSTTDLEQYVNWGGKVQYNLCGELCICKVLEMGLADFLASWKLRAPKLYARIFSSGAARGTGDMELVELAQAFSLEAVPLKAQMKSYTPGTLQRLCEASSGVIVSTKLSTVTGRITPKGVGHWVLVHKVIPERMGYGLIEIYNSAPNRIEVYSWSEFLASAGSAPYGAVIV